MKLRLPFSTHTHVTFCHLTYELAARHISTRLHFNTAREKKFFQQEN